MGLLDKIKGESASQESGAPVDKKKIEELQKKYKALLAESHKLSTTDRKASDAKLYDAEMLWKEIEKLQGK